MKIDISWIFDHSEAVAQKLQYARIDNILTPSYSTITGITASPYNITNVDNGQYRLIGTPIYADGRICEPTTQDTPSCPPIISLNAVQSGSNIEVTYVAPADAPQVRVRVDFPNGGSFNQNYTNGANDSTIIVPIPSTLAGTYQVYMQSVCDPDTNFYSDLSAPVTVEVDLTTVEMTSSAAGITITSVVGLSGFAMSGTLSPGGRITGIHDTFTGVIGVIFTGTPALAEKASLYVDDVLTDCQDIPNTSGGSISFASDTYYETQVIKISFGLGSC